MKAISLWQPWATLAVTGQKRIETRGFNTKHRGPILIHAAKKWDWKLNDLVSEIGADEILKEMGYKAVKPFKGKATTNLPLGAIIGVVNLFDTIHVEELAAVPFVSDGAGTHWSINKDLHPLEESFGDYSPGRFGWLLSHAAAFKEPIPAKGMQGFWNYDGPLPEESWELLKKF